MIRKIKAAAIAAVILLALPTATFAAEAPFGDKVSADITYYNRAAPDIGIAGLLKGNGVAEAKALGFKTIVDLRQPKEGTAPERAAAAKEGITYINIPVAGGAPTKDQVATLTKIIETAANKPVLVHCHSANRAGAIWALYRASKGVPPEIAVEEGRAVGLKSREPAVRKMLGLPPAMSK